MIENRRELLKNELEKIKSCQIQFGFQCQEIANDIYLITGKKISAQTIRRICGLLPFEGNLRGFTYSAIADYIEKKKQLNLTSFSSHSTLYSEFVSLLNALPMLAAHSPIPIKRKIHQQFLISLYKNIHFLESEILHCLENKEFIHFWWYALPPMDGLGNYAITWIQPLIQLSNKPLIQCFFKSFEIQRVFLQTGKLEINEKILSKINTHSADIPAIMTGRFQMLIIWEKATLGQKSLDHYLEETIEKWESTKGVICFTIQWQMIEALALIQQFEWARKIINLKPHIQIDSTYSHENLVLFWKMALDISINKKSIEYQSSFQTFKQHVFFAPKYYELIFTSVLLKGKYLRDFHLEKFNKRKMKLIQETGYLLFKHWPNVSEFK